MSLWFAFFISSSPLFFYYSVTLVPNILGLSFFIVGLAFFTHSQKISPWNFKLLGAALFLTLGTICKPTYLFYGLPLAFLVINKTIFEKKASYWLPSILLGIVILGTNLLMINHAKGLYDASHIERAIHTPIGPANLKIWETPWELIQANLAKSLTTWLFEMIINNAALPFFLVGLFMAWKQRKSKTLTGNFWLFWLLSFFIYSLLFVVRFKDHDYYLTSLLPLAAIISAKGANYLSDKQFMKKYGLIICCIIFTLGYTRVYKRWHRYLQVPNTLLTEATELNKHIPEQDLILIQGDKTPNVYLYFLKRKGLSISTTKDQSLSNLDKGEFKWFVHNREKGGIAMTIENAYELNKTASYNEFDIYSILPKQ